MTREPLILAFASYWATMMTHFIAPRPLGNDRIAALIMQQIGVFLRYSRGADDTDITDIIIIHPIVPYTGRQKLRKRRRQGNVRRRSAIQVPHDAFSLWPAAVHHSGAFV